MPGSRSLPHIPDGYVSRHVGDGIIVVDTVTQQAHALEGDLAVVWAALESGQSPELTVERVDQAVAALRAGGLLTDPTGLSRRTVLKAGATGVAVAGLTSLALPAVALAASTTGGTPATNPLTIAIKAGATAYVAMVGGGGGGGGHSGANGGAGTVLYVTLYNSNTSGTITVYGQPGSAGAAGYVPGGTVAGQTSYYAGGMGGSHSGSGGAASLLLATSATLTETGPTSNFMVVAAGGGGGGLSGVGNAGTAGGSMSTVGVTAPQNNDGAGGGGLVGGSAGGTDAGGQSGTSSSSATNVPSGLMVTVTTSETGFKGNAVSDDSGIANYGTGGTGGTSGGAGVTGAIYVDVIS